MHISLGFPNPQANSSLPILRWIQVGIQQVQSTKGTPLSKVRFQITPACLDKLSEYWESTVHPSRLSLWVVPSLCFAGFFLLGKLLPASEMHVAVKTYIQWGDVTVDNAHTPSMVRSHLQTSKCDQFGKGVDVFVGKTSNPRCPVIAVVAYMAARGSSSGPFFLNHKK